MTPAVRSLWSRRPRHEETADSVQFAVAAQERGPWPLVLVVECMQLLRDLMPVRR